MTRRQLRRHARRHPVLAAVAVLLGLVVLGAILRDSLGLVILGAIGAVGYWLGSRPGGTRRGVRTGPEPVQAAIPASTWPNTWPGPVDRSARETANWGISPVSQLAALTAERDQLAAEVADLRRQLTDARALAAEAADLRRQLTDARASAEAAWDAAAERPPSMRPEPGDAGGSRAALLADPLGGARPLVRS